MGSDANGSAQNQKNSGQAFYRRTGNCLIVGGAVVLLVAGMLLGYPQVYRRIFTSQDSQASLYGSHQDPLGFENPKGQGAPAATSEPSPTSTVTSTTRPGPTATIPTTEVVTTRPTTAGQEPLVGGERARGLPASRIVIPRMGVDAPVVEVSWSIVEEGGVKKTAWETADHAAGHHANSANPGEKGNVVISGHHSLKGAVFERLSELAPGDEVILETIEGSRYSYAVEESLILEEAGASSEERRAHARYMDPTSDETLTLISCWPSWTNTHRVVVVAKAR